MTSVKHVVSDMSLRITADPDPSVVGALEQHLMSESLGPAGLQEAVQLAGFIRDTDGGLTAGVYGWTWSGFCMLRYVWVASKMRGTGLGSYLLASAEKEARERKCYQVFLTAQGHDALDFYQRRGYQLAGRFDAYPTGGITFSMRKTLRLEQQGASIPGSKRPSGRVTPESDD